MKPFVGDSDGHEVGFGLGSEHMITQTTSYMPPGLRHGRDQRMLSDQRAQDPETRPESASSVLPGGASCTKQDEPLLFAPKRAWFPSPSPSGKQSKLTALGRVRRAGEGEPTHAPVSQRWARNGASGLFASHVSQRISRNFRNRKSPFEKEIQVCAFPVSS